jgi:thiamine pyrophosphokinase
MNAVILGNGSYTDFGFYKQYLEEHPFDAIFCADGGIKTALKLGIVPDVLLGDFDSVTREEIHYLKDKIKIMPFEKRKDYTDIHLCIKYAIENHFYQITLFGVLGTRADHSLTNIYLLKYAMDNGVNAKIVNEYNEIFLLNDFIKLHGVKDKTISVLPYTDKIEGINLKGMGYPLKDATMVKENPYGVSNYAVEDTVEISISSGTAVIVITQDNY